MADRALRLNNQELEKWLPGSLVAHCIVHVDRVVCAIDFGTCVNPLGVEAQMQGAINFGLAQALKSEITVSNGRVNQSNFTTTKSCA